MLFVLYLVVRVLARLLGASATIRAECLAWTLILGRGHLDRTLRTYADHYNGRRPHRALALKTPLAEAWTPSRSALETFAVGTCSAA